MGLTNQREELLRKMPGIETNIRKSNDGRFLIHKTTITSIKPVKYYGVVMNDNKKTKKNSKDRKNLVKKGSELLK